MKRKTIKKTRINFVLSFVAVIFMAGVLTYISDVSIQDKNIKKATRVEANHIRSVFDNLEDLNTKTLSSSLELITQDAVIKEIYLAKDREKLYNYLQPLFSKLKNKYGITNWSFILPDGETFLRLHNKEIYGDKTTRFTFWLAKDSGQITSGIELGETAYALRVVMPYHYNGELIGYVELGEEIDHFLRTLKNETGNKFIIVAEKQYFDREKWSSVRRIADLRDNWDTLENHLVMTSITEQEEVLNCFTEENLEEVENGTVLFQEISEKGQHFRCAGFPLVDSNGRYVGLLLSLIDISPYISLANTGNKIIFIFAVPAFIVMMMIGSLVILSNHKTKK